MKHIKTAIFLLFCTTGALVYSATNMDDKIEAAAKDSYVFKTYLKDDSVKVDAENGVVTLSGSVAQDSHKDLAEETVESLPGVTRVSNNINVNNAEKYPEGSDAWILAKVKTSLMFHRYVSGLGTDVDVKDGIVTLKGTVDSEAEKQLATEYARDIKGVKEVKNEQMVARVNSTTKTEDKNAKTGKKTPKDKMETPNVDDASITGQIKLSLLTHKTTSALNTSVDTNKGVVTLKGEAKSQAEKDYATKISKNIYGVKEVKNQMVVK